MTQQIARGVPSKDSVLKDSFNVANVLCIRSDLINTSIRK